ncbi:uncharacterized protein [Argopecten irradians]|uniref:uncharacterized protein n=1 Tax=Argopecten irradians TaxID=31199 RepID=UPI003712E84D
MFLIPETFYDKEIYNYIVLKMNSKKQLKSKVFYDDGHVHSVQVATIDENVSHCYVRAKVLPSLPTANKKDSPDYVVWVMLSKVTACVNSAYCNCTAGQGEACNHIAALLYAISDIAEKKREGKLAPTSTKCKWNNPRKRKLSPKKSQDIKFRKSLFGRNESVEDDDVKIGSETKLNLKLSTNVNRFRAKLLQNQSKAGWLTNFPMETSEDLTLPVLHNVDFHYCDHVDLTNVDCKTTFSNHFNSMEVTEAQCQQIECLTRNQSKSYAWVEARKGRLTASNFGRIVKMREGTLLEPTVKDIFAYTDIVRNKYVQWGKQHEAAARRAYINFMKKEHPGINVKQSGLVVNCKYPHLGASPDGCVYCGHCVNSNASGLLEIKCPASDKWKFVSPEECSQDPKFCCELNDGKVMLKRTHNYYYQVQGQMALSQKQWCDFVIWTCTGKISVERIPFDKDFWEDVVKKLNIFYKNAVIPELYSRRVQRGKQLFDVCM